MRKVAGRKARFGGEVMVSEKGEHALRWRGDYCTCSVCASLGRRVLRSNPYQRLAQIAYGKVQAAIQRGDLPRLDGSVPCIDCGRAAQEYDHRDYDKPLDVAAVCHRCNVRRGKAEPKSIQTRLL